MYAAMLFVIIRFIYLVSKAISMDQSKVKQQFLVFMKEKFLVLFNWIVQGKCTGAPSERGAQLVVRMTALTWSLRTLKIRYEYQHVGENS